ncbi:MAG: hypothetical protein CME34_24125 [Gordonia sp.]|nr:hypothetical protein [Gordonia sp. (in: high G+C Gram-positive bacteria)]
MRRGEAATSESGTTGSASAAGAISETGSGMGAESPGPASSDDVVSFGTAPAEPPVDDGPPGPVAEFAPAPAPVPAVGTVGTAAGAGAAVSSGAGFPVPGGPDPPEPPEPPVPAASGSTSGDASRLGGRGV